MLEGVNRVGEEAHGSVSHPVCLFAVESGVVDVTGLGIVEGILGKTETVTFGESLFLIHFRPENAVNRDAFCSDSINEVLGGDSIFELCVKNKLLNIFNPDYSSVLWIGNLQDVMKK